MVSPAPSRLALRSLALALTLAAAGALLAAGCHSTPEEPARPAGLFLVGDGAALARALAVAARFEGTPIGDASRRALERARSCAALHSSAPGGRLDELLDALSCGAPPAEQADLRAIRGDADLVVASGIGGPWTLIIGRVDALGSIEGEVRFPRDHRGMGTLLSPANSAPGPSVLSSEGRLVGARMRARAGINVERLKTRGKTSEKIRLPDFAGVLSDTVLDGSWELAVYGPPAERTVPRIALALGVLSTRAARAGMDALIGELEGSWQLHRSAFHAGKNDGACLLDLTVLPELAPCWVLAGDAIVVGWNQETLQHAVAQDHPRDDALRAGRLVVDFRAMGPVDEMLTRTAFPDEVQRRIAYPWQALEIDAVGEGRVRWTLRAGGPAP